MLSSSIQLAAGGEKILCINGQICLYGYSLIVSLRTAVAAPLYIEVQTQIAPEIISEIDIEI